MNLKKIGKTFSAILFLASTHVYATVYPIPASNESLIGEVHYTSTGSGDTVVTVSKQYDLGFNAVQKANPHLNSQLPGGEAQP